MNSFNMEIGNDWDYMLKEEFEKEYFVFLTEFLSREYEEHSVYPPKEDVLNALRASSYENTRVVILGQDPYHQQGQAHGLCFSVNKGVKIPPSLMNIYKELKRDMGIKAPKHGCLTAWAEQGVLMLNAVLTVRDSQPNSHKDKGWEQFTDAVIKKLNEREKPMVFILWGANAKTKQELITNSRHLILTGSHPSPLSAHTGYFGGSYFSRTNRFLELTDQPPIDWAAITE